MAGLVVLGLLVGCSDAATPGIDAGADASETIDDPPCSISPCADADGGATPDDPDSIEDADVLFVPDENFPPCILDPDSCEDADAPEVIYDPPCTVTPCADADGGAPPDDPDAEDDAALPDLPETLDPLRSLVWTDPALLDDPALLGLAPVLQAAFGVEHAGPMVDAWFRRFATTPHSERLGPQLLLEAFAQERGDDPAAWDVNALPFRVTGVHNRLDLRNTEHCGELRVSFASTDPLYQPLHLLLLFSQPPLPGDTTPAGELRCDATAQRWAALTDLPPEAFHAAARALLAEVLRPQRFLLAETVEFTVSPWEWRQWTPTPRPTPTPALPLMLDNPPLFQTLDTERLNLPGGARDDLLAWIAENLDAIDARQTIIPTRFRPRATRVNAGVPWRPLEVPAPLLEGRPNLRRNLEIMGCPACHTADAPFVQTLPDRTFSPFYTRELTARGDYLRATALGQAPQAPFGPLQQEPVLPP